MLKATTLNVIDVDAKSTQDYMELEKLKEYQCLEFTPIFWGKSSSTTYDLFQFFFSTIQCNQWFNFGVKECVRGVTTLEEAFNIYGSKWMHPSPSLKYVRNRYVQKF